MSQPALVLLIEMDDHAAMSLDPSPFTVGLIQMRCSIDPDDNLARACEMLRQAADRGAQIACLPELFRTQYFCQTEDAARFDLAETIPGPTTIGSQHSRRKTHEWRSSPRYSSTAQPGFTTTRPSSSTPMEPFAAAIARCIFPTTRFTTRSIISRPATSGFRRLIPRTPESELSFVGTSGTPKLPG